ncbi:hypothetical protein C0Q70_21525 [Pomacea canaliculata]|uniref:Uncharacterized protein n=1 Tax=Pomacea canaliculata TaxID=400727 RepID=A0A2T7NCR7_POMCA|nr:hypothetical protein C0Q70_21525 [Pomacea canaliculata]
MPLVHNPACSAPAAIQLARLETISALCAALAAERHSGGGEAVREARRLPQASVTAHPPTRPIKKKSKFSRRLSRIPVSLRLCRLAFIRKIKNPRGWL